jgi:urea transporter/murein DD-endopeptidase MepM/ murein hydrolase activator NlpD
MLRKITGSFLYNAYINSYSQLFFSDNKAFAYLLVLSSFVDPLAGCSGAFALLTAVAFSYWIGLDRPTIHAGTYSFNALMVGVVMGFTYNWSWQFAVVLVCGSVFCVLFMVMMQNLLAKYKVPVLSLPFLFSLWTILFGLRSYMHIEVNTRDTLFSGYLTVPSEILCDEMPLFFSVYLKSLAAIFFQYNIITGILVAIGLLIYSRIAFTLSLIGFSIGFIFYNFMVGSFTPLLYSYIGFNFILSAIALGGYFVIPSARSYILAVVATPVIAILISALANLLSIYLLPLYSLPFNIATTLFLIVMHSRSDTGGLTLVSRQFRSPEKNLYFHHTQRERYGNDTYFHIHLPFYGEWTVSQGIDGKLTHRDDWKYAWDFVVTGKEGLTYRLPGTDVTDYHCYNLPVLAPCAGTVTEVLDGIDDNGIGDVDLAHNWGNTVIIRHGDFFFSKLSHLRKESIRVKPGDLVQRGDHIGNCGSSGRSPEPHIHFQLQATPYIGSRTLKYPLSYYMSREGNTYTFNAFSYPREGELISRVTIDPGLSEAFHFIPGETLTFEHVDEKGARGLVRWNVYVDAWNHAYLHCSTTNSFAYFVNNGTLHYFTEFAGDRSSLLYHFYLANNKVLLGNYPGLKITDHLQFSHFYSGITRILQDFVAPFHIYLRATFAAQYQNDDGISITSTAGREHAQRTPGSTTYKTHIRNGAIAELEIQTHRGIQRLICAG